MRVRLRLWLPGLLGLVAVPFLLAVAQAARAAPDAAALSRGRLSSSPDAGAAAAEVEGQNDACLACHNQTGLSTTLPSGETLSLYVSPEVFDSSVHGHEGLACASCHTTVGMYPHPPLQASTRRDLSLQLYTVCQDCHATEYALTQDSVHQRARDAGQPEAAVCTDCHGSHGIQPMTDPATGDLLAEARLRIPQTCARCHSTIYDKYLTSVHGSALIGQGNPDVPTCIDCHGVHNIEDPTTAAFRLKSPELCARCHTDPERMDKYGISTQVLQTYVADFHGTTVTLFEKLSPDAETNKPVCFDCHGVHDIARTDDPQRGLQIRENLLARCQRCHPTATANFPDAWLSHYIPSPAKTPLVYAVDVFYKLFIPATLGGMAVLVALDASWQVRKRVKRPPARAAEVSKPEPPAPTPREPQGPAASRPQDSAKEGSGSDEGQHA
ncbi:MAG TPA: hypothetical protein VLD63_10035 [Anaerolineales bacterium]|nr:hypothetical protein [Anaerolineales bacterium]